MRRASRNELIDAPDDGLPAKKVGAWAERKYRVIRAYAEMFSTGMKNSWETLVYLDLFAGSGQALLGDARRRVLTSPLIALGVPHPFTTYLFCEEEQELLAALQRRVGGAQPSSQIRFFNGDCNALVKDIAAEIPQPSRTNRVLSFCFLDPYNLEIDFETLRVLSTGRALDFIVVLMIPIDANRNWRLYVGDSHERIDKLLGTRDWRARWNEAEREGVKPIRFLAQEYLAVMRRLGYNRTRIDQMIDVRSSKKNLLLYYIAYFSKSELGYSFWRAVGKSSTDQPSFPEFEA